jgi:acetyl esterase/lipase
MNYLIVKLKSSEIPITIYTPADADKDKMVVFFHGGGKSFF